MTGMGIDAYFICATPRTGSTLLCSLLRSSGIAGVPESYFRRQDLGTWAARWGLVPAPGGGVAFPDYLNGALAAGRSGNGVFGARIMWGTMEELVALLAPLYPDIGGHDGDLLRRAFGSIRYIHLARGDLVAQAVSRLKAEQTDVWHVTGDDADDVRRLEYRYDFNRIQGFVKEAEEHRAAWGRWFDDNGIAPYEVLYENLSHDPAGEALKVMDFLGLTLPSGVTLSASGRRMADGLSLSWIERFHSDHLRER